MLLSNTDYPAFLMARANRLDARNRPAVDLVAFTRQTRDTQRLSGLSVLAYGKSVVFEDGNGFLGHGPHGSRALTRPRVPRPWPRTS